MNVRRALDKNFPIITSYSNLALVATLALYPPLFLLFESLFPKGEFGLSGYSAVLTMSDFYSTLWNSILYAISTSTLSFLLGLGLALCLDRPIKFKAGFRTIILFPWLVSPVVIGLIFKWFFNDLYGGSNNILMSLGLLHFPYAFLAYPLSAFTVLVLSSVWFWTPFAMIILLAGITAIPQDMYDAALVDGANVWQRFAYVTLPSLSGVTRVLLIMLSIFTFREFAVPFTLTGGGPLGSTQTIAMYLYKVYFLFLKSVEGAALGIMLTIFCGIIGAIVMMLIRER